MATSSWRATDRRRWGRAPSLACSSRVLRDARKQTGLLLRQVGEATGLSTAQLSDMERGIGTTPLHHVELLCAVLRIQPEVLVAAILKDLLRAAGLPFEVHSECEEVVIVCRST